MSLDSALCINMQRAVCMWTMKSGAVRPLVSRRMPQRLAAAWPSLEIADLSLYRNLQ